MGRPVVHFEVIGKDADRLQSYYSDLFGWNIDASNPIPPEPNSVVIVRKSQDMAFNIESFRRQEFLDIVAVNWLPSVPTPVAADWSYPAEGIEITHVPQGACSFSELVPCFA